MLLALALAPIFFISFDVLLKDKHDREPMKQVVISFLLVSL